MAGLNQGDIVQVTLVGRLFEQQILNVFHYNISTESTSADYVTAATNFAEQFDAGTDNPTLAMLACQGVEYALDSIRVQKVYPTRKSYVEVTSGLLGAHPDECRTANIAAVITKRGPNGTRHDIGSVHIAGCPESQIVAGRFIGGYKTLLGVVATRMRASYNPALGGTQAEMVIYDKANPALSVRPLITTVRDTVRVMRRRTVGVGK